MNTINVHVVNDQKTYQVEKGRKLSDVLKDSGYPMDMVCAGKGTCGKCKVNIKDATSQRDVLSCLYEVEESLEVTLPESQSNQLKTLTKNEMSSSVKCEYRKRVLNIEQQKRMKGVVLTEYLQEACIEVESFDILKKLSNHLQKDHEALTLVLRDELIIDVQVGDTSDDLYGIAIDIGTTSVVLYVLDLITGEIKHTISTLNKQSIYGADVISRIEYASENDNQLSRIQHEILKTIEILLGDETIPEDVKYHVYSTCLCGNTTMHHLFLGINPYGLGVAPYQPVTNEKVRLKAGAANIGTSPYGDVEFLPILGGYVGADTLSVLLSIPIDNKKRLVIDLGTNGEIAVGSCEGYKVASTACGPAFEGAGITCGMRGTQGAVEAVWIDDDQLGYKVIGETNPMGICGSGIVDLIATLLSLGVIQKTGLMHSKESYRKKFGESPLIELLDKQDGQKVFYLSREDNVYISQKDVRNIQLAKSAVYSGCKILMAEYDVEEILVAGAFGNYMDLKSAESIGLIPKLEGCRTLAIGNAAGSGVMSYLLNTDVKMRADTLVDICDHVHLAEMPAFQSEYINNMGF